MEKKNNKKLFAIIGGSVLAFILTIALSVSITLAYFGNSSTQTASVTLDTKVEVGHAQTSVADVPAALPGQGIAINAKANVTAGTNGAYLLAKVETVGAEDILTNSNFALTTEMGAKWVQGTKYLVYATGADALTKLTSASEAPVLTGTFIVDPTLENDDASVAGGTQKTFTVKVTFIAVQGVFYNADGSEKAATVANAEEMADAILAQEAA